MQTFYHSKNRRVLRASQVSPQFYSQSTQSKEKTYFFPIMNMMNKDFEEYWHSGQRYQLCGYQERCLAFARVRKVCEITSSMLENTL